jgi:hypothetical protein
MPGPRHPNFQKPCTTNVLQNIFKNSTTPPALKKHVFLKNFPWTFAVQGFFPPPVDVFGQGFFIKKL